MSDEDAPDSEQTQDLEERADEIREEFASIEAEFGPIRDDLDPIRDEIEPVHDTLAAAETEDDLDDVEAELEPVRSDLEDVREAFDAVREEFDEIELPEPETDEDDEEEEASDGEDDDAPDGPIAELEAEQEALEEKLDDLEGEIEDLEDEVDDIQSDVDDQRGPYATDVIDEVESAKGDLESTRWTEEGEEELREAVEETLEDSNAVLGTSVSISADEPLLDALVDALERLEAEIEAAELDPDEDAEDIASLLEITDVLQSGVDDATAWDDLQVREQLRREGFYDVLDHVKDFPPEWHALKVHEKRGNADMILLALESLGSDFMEEHCLESLERMGPEEATEPMLQRANRRDTTAMSILGKIGNDDEDVVETLLEYVDSNPQLQRPAMRALGEVGSEEAVQPIANQLVAEEAAVRSSAARALGLIGDTRAIEPLAERIDEDDEDTVRASAVWALTQIGTERALEVAADAAGDRAYLVQAEAEKADFEPAA
ncbi:HEAT repeat domain-containing protein [Halostagnicola kamekurae]|uniref:HEAT repeat-containing protein n=1 Tax=Halostagnicola kamekurae TaxID=619731 RepID=A0A1I6S4L8_9EURY|nr:HEAT repeat domain-containing protein [Halostagnicola kamekurae]SFS71929.1 HEAT repeat-containing protein [Halostagnicola kamekurae]